MKLIHNSRRFATIAAALVLLSIARPVVAQDIADSHLAAARSAISAMRATEDFDSILPQAAQLLKNEMIQRNPDLQVQIIEIVDRNALAMATRRGDLERESALAYARVFSEAQLKEIAAFYATETGQKLITDGPIVVREILQAADIWQRGVARDLAQAVGVEFNEKFGAAAPAPEGGAGEGDAAEDDAAAGD